MSPTIILLILIGLALILTSYVISEKKSNEKFLKEIKKAGSYNNLLTDKDIDEIKDRVLQVTRQTIEEEIEDAVSEMGTLSNEKIMSITEYSEPIMNEISKAHEEVLFLYSMINEKEKEIKKSVSNANQTKDILKRHIEIVKKVEKEAIETIAKKSVQITELPTNKIQNINPKKALTAAQISSPEETPEFKYRAREESAKSSDSSTNNNKKILELYEDGYDCTEIAKNLNLGVGEVKLVIDLFKH